MRLGVRWLRTRWIELTIVIMGLAVAGLGGMRLLAHLPAGATIIYPLQALYWEWGVVVFAPVYAILVISMLLVIPFFVSTFVSRVDARTGIQIETPKLPQLLVLILVAGIGYEILEDTLGHPNEIDALKTDSHQYYLLWEMRDLNGDQFFLYECDSRGLVCEQLVVAEAGRNSLWDEDARLRVQDEHVIVRNRGRTIYEVEHSTEE